MHNFSTVDNSYYVILDSDRLRYNISKKQYANNNHALAALRQEYPNYIFVGPLQIMEIIKERAKTTILANQLTAKEQDELGIYPYT